MIKPEAPKKYVREIPIRDEINMIADKVISDYQNFGKEENQVDEVMNLPDSEKELKKKPRDLGRQPKTAREMIEEAKNRLEKEKNEPPKKEEQKISPVKVTEKAPEKVPDKVPEKVHEKKPESNPDQNLVKDSPKKKSRLEMIREAKAQRVQASAKKE